MRRIQRQLPFLQSILKEANRSKRQELLQHANADQINAVRELVLNLLKGNITVAPPVMAQLKQHQQVKTSVARRGQAKKL